MRKLVFAALAASLLTVSALACEQHAPVQHVIMVYDGDTLTTRESGSVRIAGIDTPELGYRSKCPNEDGLSRQARAHVVQRSRDGVRLERRPQDRDTDKYGRLLRKVYALDGGDIGAELVAQGLAVPYEGRGPRADWCRPGR